MRHNHVDLTGATILIVDDQLSTVDILRKTLESKGYRISLAPSGEIALGLAARTKPDLILLDVQMSGIDGFETCRRLKGKESTQEIPVIFITAYNETKRIIEGFRVGGVDYIIKPFQHEEVQMRVQTHLTLKRLQDGLRKANAEIQAKNGELEKAYNQLETENARKTDEIETACRIQQSSLPSSLPELPYLEIAAFQKPATEVGGDYYDFFLKPCEGSEPSQGLREPSKLIVAIGDATGHGVGASLMVAATKTALLTIDEFDLTKRVNKINTLLKHISNSHRLNMALTLVELEPDTHSSQVQVEATGGGMPPLIVLRSNGDVEEIMITGLPLGAMKASRYALTKLQLEKSDLLILMSDGLPERFNDQGEPLGYTQLIAEIQKTGKTERSPQGVLEALVKFGDDWSNHTPQYDDVTLVVLKVK
ncbi:SpoIIE family protein phosphatase [Candidatus Poribacteria bacterium]|nr:SpoIIE family protein phosphatase [Candidatus Poribacteria bacterium]